MLSQYGQVSKALPALEATLEGAYSVNSPRSSRQPLFSRDFLQCRWVRHVDKTADAMDSYRFLEHAAITSRQTARWSVTRHHTAVAWFWDEYEKLVAHSNFIENLACLCKVLYMEKPEAANFRRVLMTLAKTNYWLPGFTATYIELLRYAIALDALNGAPLLPYRFLLAKYTGADFGSAPVCHCCVRRICCTEVLEAVPHHLWEDSATWLAGEEQARQDVEDAANSVPLEPVMEKPTSLAAVAEKLAAIGAPKSDSRKDQAEIHIDSNPLFETAGGANMLENQKWYEGLAKREMLEGTLQEAYQNIAEYLSMRSEMLLIPKSVVKDLECVMKYSRVHVQTVFDSFGLREVVDDLLTCLDATHATPLETADGAVPQLLRFIFGELINNVKIVGSAEEGERVLATTKTMSGEPAYVLAASAITPYQSPAAYQAFKAAFGDPFAGASITAKPTVKGHLFVLALVEALTRDQVDALVSELHKLCPLLAAWARLCITCFAENRIFSAGHIEISVLRLFYAFLTICELPQDPPLKTALTAVVEKFFKVDFAESLF